MHSKQEGLGSTNEGGAVEPPSRSDGVTAGIEGVSALTDDELLAGTRRLVCVSNRVLAALLAHLAEVEARGLHRQRACSSLYTYCIYELRMPEDTAYRRVAAARFVKRFPLLLSAIERGELHLTGVLLLGPHLTQANVAGVLERAKFRTKKEILKLVRLLSPLPDVPSRIEPLGLARPAHPFSRPTWSNFVASLCPVRELQPDERPSNWMPASESNEALGFGTEGAWFAPLSVVANSFPAPVSDERAAVQPALARDGAILFALPSAQPAAAIARADVLTSSVDADERSVPESAPLELARARDGRMLSVSSSRSAQAEARGDLLTSAVDAVEPSIAESAASKPAPARVPHTAEHVLGPQRYKVQFTASEEYVALVEEAKALLAHALPRADLAEIHLRALRTLVAALKKRKYATLTGGSAPDSPLTPPIRSTSLLRNSTSAPDSPLTLKTRATSFAALDHANAASDSPPSPQVRSTSLASPFDHSHTATDSPPPTQARSTSLASSLAHATSATDSPLTTEARSTSLASPFDSSECVHDSVVAPQGLSKAPASPLGISHFGQSSVPTPRLCSRSLASAGDDSTSGSHSAPHPHGFSKAPRMLFDDSQLVLQRELAFGAALVSAEGVLNGSPMSQTEKRGSRPVQRADGTTEPRRRGRHVPAAVRRAVFERDENRCAYVDVRGERCRETSRLELHHHEPFARGGPATPENLSLYCAAHNALAAEQDFGFAVAKREHGHFTERAQSCEVNEHSCA